MGRNWAAARLIPPYSLVTGSRAVGLALGLTVPRDSGMQDLPHRANARRCRIANAAVVLTLADK
jgi:hypothetical protein